MGKLTIQQLRNDERGQTLQDYVVGISIFVVVAFAALGFFPNVLASFQADAGGDVQAQSERIADQIATNASTSGSVNELDLSVVEEITEKNEAELRDRYVLAETSNVNVTVETLDGNEYVRRSGGDNLTTDSRYYGRSAATTARIVTVRPETSVVGCQPACRLVVRVW